MNEKIELKSGARVFTASGDRVGDISRIVLDPRSKVVTHIVVEKGLLMTRDRVVPIEAVAVAHPDRLTLESGLEAEAFPEFEETRYIPMDEREWGWPWVRDYRPLLSYPIPGRVPVEPLGQVKSIERNVPDQSIAVEAGAEIIDTEGRKMGRVEEVLKEDDTATHIVVDTSSLFTELRAVPMGWVDGLMEEKVMLGVTEATLERLPIFEPARG